MKKEENTYVLEFDLDALGTNKSYKNYILDHLKKDMNSVQEKLPNGVQLDEIQFHKFKDMYRIDANTFRFLIEEIDYEAEIPTPDGTMMEMEKRAGYNLKGSFNGKIEVPAEVKNTAEMNKEWVAPNEVNPSNPY